jgi:Zn-dependent protease with chaperone function
VHVAVYLPLIVPAFAALAARPLADRLPPAAATWLFAASALALALASSAVLGMLALSALVRIPVVDGVGHLSRPVIASGDAVSLPVAIVAGGLLVIAAMAAVRAVWRRGRAIAAAHRHGSSLPGSGQVVVTEDSAADAYTVPGWPCRIVITQGMLRALSAGERDVLLAHERSHAQGLHYLFTSVARLAAAANPLLRPVAAQAGYTVERWADERAATQASDRRLAARAIARAALATSAAPPDRDAAMSALGLITQEDQEPQEGQRRAGLPGAGLARASPPRIGLPRIGLPRVGLPRVGLPRADLHRAGPVPRRVAALLAPPPRLRLLLLAAALLLVAVSGASALEAARNFHQLIELAQGPARLTRPARHNHAPVPLCGINNIYATGFGPAPDGWRTSRRNNRGRTAVTGAGGYPIWRCQPRWKSHDKPRSSR